MSKQQKLDLDPKAIQQINFTWNLDRVEGSSMFFITEEAKETVVDFLKGEVKVFSQANNIGPQDTRGRPPPTSPGPPLNFLFYRDALKWRPGDVLIWRSRDVP